MMKSWVKILLVIIVAVFAITTFADAAKKKKKEKDCIYCKKYEKMENWL